MPIQSMIALSRRNRTAIRPWKVRQPLRRTRRRALRSTKDTRTRRSTTTTTAGSAVFSLGFSRTCLAAAILLIAAGGGAHAQDTKVFQFELQNGMQVLV